MERFNAFDIWYATAKLKGNPDDFYEKFLRSQCYTTDLAEREKRLVAAQFLRAADNDFLATIADQKIFSEIEEIVKFAISLDSLRDLFATPYYKRLNVSGFDEKGKYYLYKDTLQKVCNVKFVQKLTEGKSIFVDFENMRICAIVTELADSRTELPRLVVELGGQTKDRDYLISQFDEGFSKNAPQEDKQKLKSAIDKISDRVEMLKYKIDLLK